MTKSKHITIDTLWKEAGFTPNDEQRAAIQHVDGPLYLTAGPGSGKTRVLLWRTVNLLVFHGVKPEDKKYANDIAWETEVWIAEMPSHMIHLNGDKFLGPR